uniref:dual-specificity kinase n=1 Tax=Auxenochlorella protothecoides TaxID=3075 RepID=A0A1D2A6M6_AUXPR
MYSVPEHGDALVHTSAYHDYGHLTCWDGPKAPRLDIGQTTPRASGSYMGFTEPCTPQKQADGFVTMQSVGSMPAREWQPGPHPTDGSDWAAAARVGQPLHPSSLPSQHHLLHATSLPRTWHGAGDQAPPPIRTEPRPEARQGSEHSSGLTPRIAEMSLQLPQAPSWPEAEAAPGARAPHAGLHSIHPPPGWGPDLVTGAPAPAPAGIAVHRSSASAPSLSAPPAPRPHMAAAEALALHGHLLTAYERAEVLAYPRVWFVGAPGVAKVTANHAPGLDPDPVFVDERGDYVAVAGDHVAYRYEVQRVLGQGSFGQVLCCADHAAGGRPVALKVMRGRKRFQKQALVETRILSLLQGLQGGCPGIVAALGCFSFRGHLCIAFELLSINLYELLQERRMLGCGSLLVRRVAVQVLTSLEALVRAGIVHCDIKPENIMLVDRKRSDVKLIDFGSSCFKDKRAFTYIQSRFYRAPEVILGEPYGHAIDMWSLGCVLAELRTGAPLFPGEDEKEQLACIMEVLGKPPSDIALYSARAPIFFDPESGEPRSTTLLGKDMLHRPGSVTLTRALGGVVGRDASFVRFVAACLRWRPEERLTPAEALRHEWIAG